MNPGDDPNRWEEGEELALEQRAESAEERDEIDGMLREIRGSQTGTFPRIARYIGLALAGITLLSLGILTFVSVQEVPFSTRIYGPTQVVPGSYASYRVALFDSEKNHFLNKIRASFWLVGATRRELLYTGKTPWNVVIANVRVPKWPLGNKYKLEVQVQGPRGRESLVRPIQLVASDKRKVIYVKDTSRRFWDSVPKKRDPYKVRIFTEGRSFVSDLPNQVYVRIQERKLATLPKPASRPTSQPSSLPTFPIPARDAASKPTNPPIQRSPSVLGEPRRTRKLLRNSKQPIPVFPLQRKKPIPTKKQAPWKRPKSDVTMLINEGSKQYGPYISDARGFVRLAYMPQFFQVKWKLGLNGREGSVDIPLELRTDGYQISLEPDRVLVKPGETLKVHLDSLQRRGLIHFDLVHQGQRIWSQKSNIKAGKSTLYFSIPKDVRGICSIQAYTEFFFPGEVYDTRLIYVGEPSQAAVLKGLRKQLIQRGDGVRVLELQPFEKETIETKKLESWSRALFAYTKSRFVPPGLLFDSASARLKKLRAFQGDFRSNTLFFLGGLGGFVLLAMFGWMLWGYQRDQRMIQEAAEQGVGELESRGFFIIILAFVLMALIFAVILYLFWAMKWTYDFL